MISSRSAAHAWTIKRRPPATVGRDGELAALHGCLQRAADGRSGVAIIEGELGIGKTRLVEETIARARESGLHVLRGAADSLDRTRPFASLASAFEDAPATARQERGELRRLLEEAPAGPGTPPIRFPMPSAGLDQRYLDGVVAVLERLALRSPILLVLEDLHWADVGSLLAIRAVRQRFEHLPILMLVTRRLHPEPAELAAVMAMLRDAAACHLALDPLPEAAVTEIVIAAAGARPGPVLCTQLAGARGNPLFVLELLRALIEESALTFENGVVDIDEPVFPPNLRGALLANLSGLSRETMRQLQLASVLGNQFRAADLSQVAGLSAVELLPLLSEALDSGILEAAPGDRLAFRHDLIRQVIYGDLVPSMRSALHLQAGRALAAAGAPVIAVASHMVRGAAPGDAQAVEWLRDAVEAALPRAPKVALELAQRALELAGPDNPCRGDLLVAQVNALLWTGTPAEAEAVIRRTLVEGGADGGLREALRAPLGMALIRAGRPGEALKIVGEGPTPDVSPRDARQLMVAAGMARLQTGDMKGAAASAAAAVAASEPPGDAAATVPALCLLSHVARLEGRAGEAIDLATRALALAERSDLSSRWPCDRPLALALIDSDRLDEARSSLWRGLQRSRDRDGAWNLALYQWASVQLDFIRGNWEDGLAGLEAGVRAVEEAGISMDGAMEAMAWRARVALHHNRLADAQASLDLAEAHAEVGGTQAGRDQLLHARALLEEAVGQPVRALRVMTRAWEICPVAGLPRLGPDMVRMLQASGQMDLARQRTVEVEAAAQLIGSPSARAAGMRCRSLVEGFPGSVVRATGLLRQADRPLELAQATEEAGAALLSHHRPYAIVMLDESATVFDRLGAARDAARVRAKLRALGVRRGSRGARRPRPSMGWDSLTPTEMRIIGLVLDGLTSPQIAARTFVSRRTVETHVAHVFRKLGVRSRAQLRGAASQARHEAHRPGHARGMRGAPAIR